MECPFCCGIIREDAVKCRHCGEWVVAKESSVAHSESSESNNAYLKEVGESVKELRGYYRFRTYGSIISAILVLLFSLIYINSQKSKIPDFKVGSYRLIEGEYCLVEPEVKAQLNNPNPQ